MLFLSVRHIKPHDLYSCCNWEFFHHFDQILKISEEITINDDHLSETFIQLTHTYTTHLAQFTYLSTALIYSYSVSFSPPFQPFHFIHTIRSWSRMFWNSDIVIGNNTKWGRVGLCHSHPSATLTHLLPCSTSTHAHQKHRYGLILQVHKGQYTYTSSSEWWLLNFSDKRTWEDPKSAVVTNKHSILYDESKK